MSEGWNPMLMGAVSSMEVVAQPLEEAIARETWP